ncbi:FMN-linked oxidoreductase [Setomelanomma holmii]|uniref:FMN-linked oxidoreductase n=1 Tax=Setomelanomma holmii TaxID=210430 RepID=A0A9P4LQ33_9PLEO|nr:FMN-linked oxidoreductase [Setomelanomma holmii]
MEYDKSTTSGASEAQSYPHESTNAGGRNGKLRVQGAKTDVSGLAESITFPFSGRTAKNRFLKAPMTERICHWPEDASDIQSRGFPSEAYTHLYQRWGEGDIGIIVAGNLMIRYDAVEAYGNPILQDNHDNRIAAFRKVADAAKAHGSLFIAQLSHPGRQGTATLNPEPVSASDVQLQIKWAGNWFAKPRALTIAEIGEMVKWWGEAARLCCESGFDGIQIHCAHGYLLAQFLSQTTNKRTDAYGGSFENRCRIIFEIINEVKRVVPDRNFIICVKLNSVEFQPGGQTPEDCRNLCLKLEEQGVDFLDLSGGTFEGRAFEHKKESTKKREAYFIEFAEQIRPMLKKTVLYVTGGFRTAAGMASAIQSGACDGVGIGRPLGAEPYLCKEILEGTVDGAIENFVPLPKNTQATGSQLHQIGYGDRLISDWSDEGEVKRWLKADEVEDERKIKILPKVDSSGYPRIKAQSGFEYLRAAA